MAVVVVQQGSVADLHALDPFADDGPAEPAVWWCQPSDDAIVLGSGQRDDVVDRDACERAGLAVVRRRSGGGAVIIRRSCVLWVDVVLPPGVAPDDVRGSMEWIGERWCRVLASVTAADLEVHRGGMVTNEWSDLVCFAGTGPGEVVTGGEKLVGLSQRRTRRGIRVQSLLYDASVVDEYRDVLKGKLPASELGGQTWIPGLDHEAIVADLAHQISTA